MQPDDVQRPGGARASGERRLYSPTRADDASSQRPVQKDLERAVHGLRARWPELSAGAPVWAWQKAGFLCGSACFALAAVLVPEHAIVGFAGALVLPFFCVVMLRTAALWNAAIGPRMRSPPIAIVTTPLPTYTLLVPLYDEAAVVPDLVAALDAIDYPRDRLQILLIVEACDASTRAAVEAARLTPPMSVVVVPDGAPRTKPRALNFALCRATGDFVVVYDAEDVPEPGQLRRAVAMFAHTPGLACVQGRLNVLNAEENWLTRQFAIEYTALFDCLLPTLQRLGLPVPLGGTSNHLPRPLLQALGGWDPFNVTEDADLGIRLARRGLSVQVLASTTWEEAPDTFRSWLTQRTRWLKGWMQTYLVHMRNPARTARDLGWASFLGLQVLMGGLIISALVHPWFYILAAFDLSLGPVTTLPHPLSTALWAIGVTNLVLGYATGVVLGCVAVIGRGRYRLAAWTLTMPLYWLLVSLAAYRALFQLMSAPYRWEKTRHRPRAAFLASRSAD